MTWNKSCHIKRVLLNLWVEPWLKEKISDFTI